MAPVALARSPSRAPIVRLDGAARGTASAHSPRFRTLVLFGLATFRRPRKIAEAVNVAVGVINGDFTGRAAAPAGGSTISG